MHADVRVLAHLLAVYDVAHALPTAKRIGEFFLRALAAVPGVESCSMCFTELSEPVLAHGGGGVAERCCTICPAIAGKREGAGYSCPQPEDGQIRVIRVETLDRLYGHLLVALSDASRFSPYAPTVLNLANSIAVVLESRRQKAQIEKLLRETERRFRETLEGIHLVGVTLDAQGNITFCNDFLLNLTGWERDQVLGKNWFDLFVPPELAVKSLFIECIATGSFPPHFENAILTRQGQRRLIAWNNTVLRDPQGHVTGTSSIGEDVTKQKADESKLVSMDRQLRHANRLAIMGELSAGIAHEVNQSLCSIVNFAKATQNLISQPDPDLARIREWNNAIATAAARAGGIVRRIRGFARRSETKPSRVAVEDLVQDALSLVRCETQAKKATIATSSSEPGLQVEVHPVQVQQVLVNLLRNAIEAFSDQHDRPPKVTVAVTGRDDEIEVSVIDNGPGLPATGMNELFATFFTTKPEGVGMGLAISKTIVESYGGRIWAESNPEGGASFHFTLPRTRGD